MKKTPVLFLACTLFLFAISCSSSSDEKTGTADKTFTAFFSDTLQADTFKVNLVGSVADQSQLEFSIIDYTGKEIYNAKIEGKALLQGNPKLKTEAEKMAFLKREVNYFFEEENFLDPAVMPDEQADKNVPDTTFYNELKNTKLPGFILRTGEENKIYIGWSVKEKKVKKYYHCC